MRVGKAEQRGVDGAPQLTGEQGNGCNNTITQNVIIKI